MISASPKQASGIPPNDRRKEHGEGWTERPRQAGEERQRRTECPAAEEPQERREGSLLHVRRVPNTGFFANPTFVRLGRTLWVTRGSGGGAGRIEAQDSRPGAPRTLLVDLRTA